MNHTQSQSFSPHLSSSGERLVAAPVAAPVPLRASGVVARFSERNPMMDGAVGLMGGTVVLDTMRLRSGRLIENNMPQGMPEFVRPKAGRASLFDGSVNMGSSRSCPLGAVPEAVSSRLGRSKDPDSSDDDVSTASEPKPQWAPKVRRRGIPGKAVPSSNSARGRAATAKKPGQPASPMRSAGLAGVPMKRSLSSGSASGKGAPTATAQGVLLGLGIPMRKSRSHGADKLELASLEPLPLARSAMSDLAVLSSQLDLA